ncbi:MAG: hypothetical protein ACR2NY_06440 [Alphaproteobacteria bacterium]
MAYIEKMIKYLAIGLFFIAMLGFTHQAKSQTAEEFGYGSKVVSSPSKRIWYHVRIDSGLLLPGDAIIVRDGSADKLEPDGVGWDIGFSFGGSFNRGSIVQVDVTGVVNYSRWHGSITPGVEFGNDPMPGNKILVEGTKTIIEANWRPLVSDKGFISPFLGLGLGMDIVSWLNSDISKTPNYKKSALGVIGIFQISSGFDWFFATNWAIGFKYNYWLPFSEGIEVGSISESGVAKPIIYNPSNSHALNFSITAAF